MTDKSKSEIAPDTVVPIQYKRLQEIVTALATTVDGMYERDECEAEFDALLDALQQAQRALQQADLQKRMEASSG